ncbi:MAG: hypothetical protein V3U26_03430, partial [Dehalococcoidia bacterium]
MMALYIEDYQGFGILKAGTRPDGTDMIHVIWNPRLQTPVDLKPVILAKTFEEARKRIDENGAEWRRELRDRIRAEKQYERAYFRLKT